MSNSLESKSCIGEPTWEVASLYPLQGEWTAEDYLSLNTNRLIELSDGTLEVLPMPTELHQLIAFYLCNLLCNRNSSTSPGVALLAPFRVRLPSGKFREPDIMFMLHEHAHRRHQRFWEGADLVIEIVSEDDPNRDLIIKRSDYAQAGISEYWIVDPRDRSICILILEPGAREYTQLERYFDGQIAGSTLLDDLRVEVTQVFNQSSTSAS